MSDHSVDNSIEALCSKWAVKLNLKYIRNTKGRGFISPNLNNAMSYCDGEWIKILFQDDFLYADDSLDKQFRFINNNQGLNWFATRFIHTKDGVNFYSDYTPTWNEFVWSGHNTIGCPSVITFKNDSVIQFDEDLNWLMDCDWYWKMFKNFGSPKVLHEITVVNRNNSGRLTNAISEQQKINEYEKLKKIYA